MKNKLEDFKIYLINLQQSTVYYNYMKKVFDYLEEKNIMKPLNTGF